LAVLTGDAVTTSWPPDEHLLGFDAREMLATAGAWPQERREKYLLRPEASRPLSADPTVWLSLFEDGASVPRDGLPNLALPGWTGPNGGLWDDLAHLEANLASVQIQIPYWLVAVTWLADDASHRERRGRGPSGEPMTPKERSPDWTFLGFDVGDAGMLSGLMNCGSDADERPALIEEWGLRLNEHHLLTDAQSAFEFRGLANRRVVEHAPFFVYGLWVIRKVVPQ
jgi:hypothetical protein